MEDGEGDGAREMRVELFRVGPLPSIFYIPNYASETQQLGLLKQVNSAPVSKWKILKNRRLQNWGGMVHEKGLIPQPLPPWLSALTEKIFKDTGLFPAPINHVLVNEYAPGQGIMPHQDGPAYFPVVAILSIGSPVLIQFNPHPRIVDGSHVSLILMPGSLLIFKDSAYQDYLHGIEDVLEHKLDDSVVNRDVVECDYAIAEQSTTDKTCNMFNSLKRNGTRVSLTCRLVPRVCKHLIKL